VRYAACLAAPVLAFFSRRRTDGFFRRAGARRGFRVVMGKLRGCGESAGDRAGLAVCGAQAPSVPEG
jgi:hypothetical protein